MLQLVLECFITLFCPHTHPANCDRDAIAAELFYLLIDNFIHRKETIEHNTNQIKLNNN